MTQQRTFVLLVPSCQTGGALRAMGRLNEPVTILLQEAARGLRL
jgi:hypothetical protein